MKVKRMGITEILRRIWLFSADKIESSDSFSKQSTQLIVKLNSSLRHIIVTIVLPSHHYLLWVKRTFEWGDSNPYPKLRNFVIAKQNSDWDLFSQKK